MLVSHKLVGLEPTASTLTAMHEAYSEQNRMRDVYYAAIAGGLGLSQDDCRALANETERRSNAVNEATSVSGVPGPTWSAESG